MGQISGDLPPSLDVFAKALLIAAYEARDRTDQSV